MKNKIEDLRNHLFATLEALQDKDNPMAVDRAQAIADVARVIVESAKAECEHMKLTRSVGTGFIPLAPPTETAPNRDQAGRIEVKEDGGGTFPYAAKHLKHETAERPKITSPIVPTGQARFVPGRQHSGSR